MKRLVEDDGDLADPELKDALIDIAPTHEKFMRDLAAAFPDFEFSHQLQDGPPGEFGKMFGFVAVAKNRRTIVPRRAILAFARRWFKAAGIAPNPGTGGYSYPADWARRFLIFP